MSLTVNGEKIELPSPSMTVAELLELLGYKDHFVAVAINSDCIRRLDFESHRLSASDKVEILAPMAGG